MFRSGRDSPDLPFFSQADLQTLHEYTQEFGDDPSRPIAALDVISPPILGEHRHDGAGRKSCRRVWADRLLLKGLSRKS